MRPWFRKEVTHLYVVSFISGGQLKATAIRHRAEEAVDQGYEWHKTYSYEGSTGDYISIDQSVDGNKENIRFAEIRLDSKKAELMLFLDLTDRDKRKKPIFAKPFRLFYREMFICFLEFAVARANDYFKEKNNTKNDYSSNRRRTY